MSGSILTKELIFAQIILMVEFEHLIPLNLHLTGIGLIHFVRTLLFLLKWT